MNKSTKNIYDYTIDNYNNYIINDIFNYTGEYEFTLNQKFIKIIGYTNGTDKLTVSHSTQPHDNYIIYSDEYNLINTTKTFLIDIKSNFFKINIQSIDLSNNRIYNTYLESSDINTRLYNGNGTEVNADSDGNIITKSIIFDSSGNDIFTDGCGNILTKSLLYDYNGRGIDSTNNSLNVYNIKNLSQTTDSIKSYLYDSNGNDINADNNGNLYITSSRLDDIYNLLNTRGSATLFNNSNSENSSVVDFTNKKITSITIYGTCSAATTLILQCSNNNSTWYSSQYMITINSESAFGFSLTGFCPKYFRLYNQNFVTSAVTAYVDYC
jgi:hypothetical protein